MDDFIDWLLARATRKTVTVLLIGYFVFPLYLLPLIINEGSTGPFDLLFFYDADTVYQMLADYGEALRQRYVIGLLTVDALYPIYYSLLMSLFIGVTIKSMPGKLARLRYFMLLPFLVMLSDLVENTLLISLLTSYPEKLNVVAGVAGYVTCAKWLMFAIAMLVVGLLLIQLFIQKRQSNLA